MGEASTACTGFSPSKCRVFATRRLPPKRLFSAPDRIGSPMKIRKLKLTKMTVEGSCCSAPSAVAGGIRGSMQPYVSDPHVPRTLAFDANWNCSKCCAFMRARAHGVKFGAMARTVYSPTFCRFVGRRAVPPQGEVAREQGTALFPWQLSVPGMRRASIYHSDFVVKARSATTVALGAAAHARKHSNDGPRVS